MLKIEGLSKEKGKEGQGKSVKRNKSNEGLCGKILKQAKSSNKTRGKGPAISKGFSGKKLPSQNKIHGKTKNEKFQIQVENLKKTHSVNRDRKFVTERKMHASKAPREKMAKTKRI